MREPEHAPRSFKANTFARFARKHGLFLEINPVDPMGLIESPFINRTKHFISSITYKGRYFTMPLQFEHVRNTLPPIEDVLEYIANEVVAYHRFGTDAEAFASYTGMPAETLLPSLLNAQNTATAFKTFLGPEIYDEFRKISEVRG